LQLAALAVRWEQFMNDGIRTEPNSPEGARPRGLALSQQEFARLVEPHLTGLVKAAKAILSCEHHAQDAVQEALLSLWCEPQPPPNLGAWLLRAVKYRSLELRRCCHRRRQREMRAACARPECRCCEGPARAVEEREARALLARACARLPAELREVFLLREVEQLDYHAIAERLRVPVGTVRSRLSRSRLALRGLLEEALAC
jgi:RNA polymerase sigma factor (sigma-70 family)